MPNQYNFRTDVTNITEPRFTASRVVSVQDQSILLETIPASFGFEDLDNIEVHLYSDPANNLIVSTIINLPEDIDVIKSHVVFYENQTFKNYIRIDFTKLFENKNLIIPSGQYRMVLNFFSNEIGSYNDRKLFVQTISPSRTEVELSYYPTQSISTRRANENELREFVQKSFDKPVAAGVTDKIFRSGVRLDDPTEGVTYESLVNNIEIESIDQTFDNTIQLVKNLNLEEVFSQQLESFIVSLYDDIVNEINLNGDRRIQEDEFQTFVNDVIERRVEELQSVTDSKIFLN